MKLFPPEGPEFKREAFAMNNWASVRGCGWRGSKALVGLGAVPNANIRDRLSPGGKCDHPEMEPLATRRRKKKQSATVWGCGEAAGLGARRPGFSVGIWVSDQGF